MALRDSSICARDTRLAGSVRDRERAVNLSISSQVIANPTARRHPAMMPLLVSPTAKQGIRHQSIGSMRCRFHGIDRLVAKRQNAIAEQEKKWPARKDWPLVPRASINPTRGRPQGQEPDARIAGLAADVFPCYHVTPTLFSTRGEGHGM